MPSEKRGKHNGQDRERQLLLPKVGVRQTGLVSVGKLGKGEFTWPILAPPLPHALLAQQPNGGRQVSAQKNNGTHGRVCAPQPSPAGDHYLAGSQIAPPTARSMTERPGGRTPLGPEFHSAAYGLHKAIGMNVAYVAPPRIPNLTTKALSLPLKLVSKAPGVVGKSAEMVQPVT